MSWLNFLRPKTPPPAEPEPAAYKLEDALKSQLAPVLRANDFKGSGRTYRRVTNRLIQIVNIQGSQWGNGFALNLGIQPLDLDWRLDGPSDPRALKEYDCMLRCRLSETDADQWWKHDSLETALAAVSDAARLCEIKALPMLDRQSGPEAPLWTLSPEALSAGRVEMEAFRWSTFSLARDLARLRRATGDLDTARVFAVIAMQSAKRRKGIFSAEEERDLVV
jgi:hypothetical protein